MSNKHTAGPWFWKVNDQTKNVLLVSSKGAQHVVMDFERWGMQSAKPRFNSASVGSGFSVMQGVEQYSAAIFGQEHNASWNKTIIHPDAQLIAAAPELLDRTETNERVFEHVRACAGWLSENHGQNPEIKQWIENLLSPVNAQKPQNEAAIAKATGTA